MPLRYKSLPLVAAWAIAFLLAAASSPVLAQAERVVASPPNAVSADVGPARDVERLVAKQGKPHSADRVERVELDEGSVQRACAGIDPRAAASRKGVDGDIAAGARRVRLPVAGGAEAEFVIAPSGAFHPDLAAAYPEIRSFAGYRADDPRVRIRLEYAPERGWTYETKARDHRVWLSAVRGVDGKRDYRLVDASARPRARFGCEVHDDAQSASAKTNDAPDAALGRAGDGALRKYRLAVTCTGEYAQAVSTGAATVAQALAAMNVAVNRVNEVYERDLGITLELIPDNGDLVFLNGATDPYTEGSAGAMIGEVQTSIDGIVGSAAYDIGHIFSTDGAGLASLGCVCDNSRKARGVTGINPPTGDFFYIDYVAHEIGHQFGATHTFNNSCGGNRSAGTAFEPGSGSTIMAYAGICSPNVQNRSDDYFHAASLEQVGAFVAASGGTCAEVVSTANQQPLVAAVPDYSIPVATAFELTAAATDPDTDDALLTYAWEQFDNETGQTMPPASTNTAGPAFRSLPPSPRPARRFPSGGFATYEVLPTVARDLNFRVTVRDNDPRYGTTAEATTRISTVGTEPFRITNYDDPATLTGLQAYTVTWAVAGTDVAPVDAPTVDVYFSRDGGATYSDTLASAVANTGAASVTVPNVATAAGRFVVKGHDHVFLDVNDADLVVQETATATFTLTALAPVQRVCSGVGAAAFAFEVEALLGFSDPVNLAVRGLPAGVTATISPNGASGTFSPVVRLAGTDGLAVGSYPFTVEAQGGGVQRSAAVTLVRQALATQAPQALSPADGTEVGAAVTAFEWTYDASIGEVRLELSPDPLFPANNTFAQNFTEALVNARGITEGVWFWRVAYVNDCGVGPYSELSSFLQVPLDEEGFVSTTAVPIDPGPPGTYTSTIDVARAGQVYRAEVGVGITHTYVGDLDATLTLPAGPTLALFEVTESCSQQDINAVFADDAAATAAEFANTCAPAIPAIAGEFQPVEAFATRLPREGSGTYTLTVNDDANLDGGSLDDWSVSLWYRDVPPYAPALTRDTVRVVAGGTQAVTPARLRAADPLAIPSEVRWVIKRTPALGLLEVGGIGFPAGASFTQADVDLGRVRYVHNGAPAPLAEDIVFDLVVGGVGYFPNLTLPVRVLTTSLTATATVTATPACAGEATGAISVAATDGQAPYSYSLSGGAFGSGSTFANLAAGNYTVTVRDGAGFEFGPIAVTIGEPDPLALTVDVSGSTVTAAATGGTGALSYRLGGGALQASGTFANVPNGSTAVTVVDANGCTATQTVVVAVGALVVGLDVTEPIACSGDRGALTATVAGGTAPYAYSLNGGATQSDPTFGGLPAGSYLVTVTDATGATATSDPAVALTEPAALAVTAAVTGSSVAATAAGGTAPYVYSVDGVSFQSGTLFENLANGTYALTARDANGCEATTPFAVSVNSVVASLEVVTEISCAGETTGALFAEATGGRAPYAYSLNGGPFVTASLFGDLGPGTYVVTARDADGFEDESIAVTLTEPAALAVSAAVSGSAVTLTASGGTAPYAYRLSPDGDFQPDATFGPLAAGTYTFTARDANGCTADVSVVVSAGPLAVVIDFDLGQESCPGAADGAVTLRGVNGTPPYEYAVGGQNFSSQASFANLAPGSYQASVRDAVGDVATANFDILTRDAPTASVTVEGSRVEVVDFSQPGAGVRYSFDGGQTFTSDPFGYVYAAGPLDVIVRYGNCEARYGVSVTSPLALTIGTFSGCEGDDDVEGTFCVEGGSGGYAIVTNPGLPTPTTLASCAGDAYALTVPAGVSSVNVQLSDATGATRSASVAVVLSPAPAVSGNLNANTLTVSVSGGTAPFAYSLDGGATTQASPVFADLADGAVTVTVIDANGCRGAATFTVSAAFAPAAALGVRAYPNPAAEVLTLEAPDENPAVRAVLVDLTGRQVLAKARPATRERIDVSHLATGVYTLVVELSDGARARVPVVVR